MSKAYVLTGLGYGDECKGATTHFICHREKAHTVIRTGGPQAMHNVLTGDGQYYCFAQYGSGTLAGARTHLSQDMVIEPFTLLQDGEELRSDYGISDIFERMTIDERSLIVTPFQIAANRLRELARGAGRHGSVGLGVGDTILDGELLGDEVIFARDLGKPWLSEKLEAIRQLKLQQLSEIIQDAPLLPERAKPELALLNDPKMVDKATAVFNKLGWTAGIVDDSYLAYLLRQPGTVVFEPSQGVLLDRWYGWHPYTTRLDTTSSSTLRILRDCDYQGEVIRLGLIRAYQTRHGAGPFVTEDKTMTQLLPDQHNGQHEWQGHWRVGTLDILATRYAIGVCGGPKAFDGLVVSCLDRMATLPVWQVCYAYQYTGADQVLSPFFEAEGLEITGIKVRPNSRDQAQLSHQEKLGVLLRQCQPRLTDIENDFRAYLAGIEDRFGIPVAVASYGPTEEDKKIFTLFTNLSRYA